MDDYISKPVTLETLRCVLAKWTTDRVTSPPDPKPSCQAASLASLSIAVAEPDDVRESVGF
jgi:two-component SAPR family response regulator